VLPLELRRWLAELRRQGLSVSARRHACAGVRRTSRRKWKELDPRVKKANTHAFIQSKQRLRAAGPGIPASDRHEEWIEAPLVGGSFHRRSQQMQNQLRLLFERRYASAVFVSALLTICLCQCAAARLVALAINLGKAKDVE
jgi:hypothetical protein